MRDTLGSMNALTAAIRITWRRNAEYGLRLVGDLSPGQWIEQPIGGRVMNHPAWVVAHLTLYAEIAVRLCLAEKFDDPAEHPHGQKSEPLAILEAYPKPQLAIETWRSLHESGAAALLAATDAITSAPNPLERWRAVHPTVGDMLVTLMVKHESAHLGQLSAWRRAMGLARVPM